MALEAGEVALEVAPWMRPEAEGDASDGEVRGSHGKDREWSYEGWQAGWRQSGRTRALRCAGETQGSRCCPIRSLGTRAVRCAGET